jgi:hypothetical protein
MTSSIDTDKLILQAVQKLRRQESYGVWTRFLKKLGPLSSNDSPTSCSIWQDWWIFDLCWPLASEVRRARALQVPRPPASRKLPVLVHPFRCAFFYSSNNEQTRSETRPLFKIRNFKLGTYGTSLPTESPGSWRRFRILMTIIIIIRG